MKHVAVYLLALSLLAVPCLAQQEQQAEPEAQSGTALWEETVYFSVGFGGGVTFPVGLMGEIMDMGSNAEASALLNFNFPWGGLGFGLHAGAIGHSVGEQASSPYNLGAFPVAVEARYETRFMMPFYLFGAFDLGAVFNTITYRDDFYDERSRNNAKLFLAPTAGFGVHIAREMAISLWASLPVIAFNGTAYTAISAGLKFDYTL